MVPEFKDYRVIHRKVKYPRIEMKTGEVVFILPCGQNPDEIIEKYSDWILKKKRFIEERLKEAEGKELVERDVEELKEIINEVVQNASTGLEEKVEKVKFRSMKTKWASMSRKRTLTINPIMRMLPKRLIEYIVFHEVAHLKERRHNERFWKIIRRKFKDYEDLEKELFTYWFLIHTKHFKKSV